jgi:hypothetical protein
MHEATYSVPVKASLHLDSGVPVLDVTESVTNCCRSLAKEYSDVIKITWSSSNQSVFNKLFPYNMLAFLPLFNDVVKI